MSAPTKNQNAAKPESDRASSFLHVRVKQSDKASWVRKASGQKLAQWVNQILNEAARDDERSRITGIFNKLYQGNP